MIAFNDTKKTFMVWLTCVISCSMSLRFNLIYSLGDSITDTGRIYALTKHAAPPDSIYYKGRFSNGITWVEYLARRFGAQLISYAHGKATTDNNVFKADAILNIPGCVQQADMFLRQPYTPPETTLMTMAFFGNDFFNPKATPGLIMENMNNCIRKVAPRIKHLLVPTSLAPDMFPYFMSQNQTFLNDVAAKAEGIRKIWEFLLPRLKQEYPNINFYSLNFREFMVKLQNERVPGKPNVPLNTQESCIVIPSGGIEPLPATLPCSNPGDYAFYDPVHFTTSIHKKLAETAFKTITSKA